jgi:hypothetical protein
MQRSIVAACLGAALLAAAGLWWLRSEGSGHSSEEARAPLAKPALITSIATPVVAKAVIDRAASPASGDIKFTDVTAAAGIDFEHFNGWTPLNSIMEAMGSGAAWLDYDQDGLMDLFLVQGWTVMGPPPKVPVKSRLFKNLGNGRFRDVTDEVGLGHQGYGMGVAVGDIDNDGYPDLFLTCYGKPNVLYHNESDGKGGRRFVDITARAGLASCPDWRTRPNWSTSACFLDYNNDGRLDLFVCSYVAVDPAHYPECLNDRKTYRQTCAPKVFPSTRCLLYRNNGDLTFTEVGHEAGVDRNDGKALGVVAADFDDDGLIDLFVANDGVPNFLFRNLGNGRFQSFGLESGCAVNLDGGTQAYMGVDADDLDGDGRPDLFVTAYARETNTFFRNEGKCQFLDVTQGSGLGPPSWFMLAFGTCFLDVDNDGALDIAVANGHVDRDIGLDGNPNVTFREPAQLFWNDGHGRFRDISADSGSYFREPHVGRGLALADYDNDGRMDMVFTNGGERAALLHNDTRSPNHWLRLELVGTKSNRDAVGAKVTVRAGGLSIVRQRKGGSSYLSAHDPRLLIGLGPARQADQVEIRWPSGLVERLGPLRADRGYRIVEGKEQRP